jgi:hypothetical protein
METFLRENCLLAELMLAAMFGWMCRFGEVEWTAILRASMPKKTAREK